MKSILHLNGDAGDDQQHILDLVSVLSLHYCHEIYFSEFMQCSFWRKKLIIKKMIHSYGLQLIVTQHALHGKVDFIMQLPINITRVFQTNTCSRPSFCYRKCRYLSLCQYIFAKFCCYFSKRVNTTLVEQSQSFKEIWFKMCLLWFVVKVSNKH